MGLVALVEQEQSGSRGWSERTRKRGHRGRALAGRRERLPGKELHDGDGDGDDDDDEEEEEEEEEQDDDDEEEGLGFRGKTGERKARGEGRLQRGLRSSARPHQQQRVGSASDGHESSAAVFLDSETGDPPFVTCRQQT